MTTSTPPAARTHDAADRVLLTLLGLADATGFLESFPKTEALDFAETPSSEFERVLDAHIAIGSIVELPREGRAARRFRIPELSRRTEAVRYVDARREGVRALTALRSRLEPGRAELAGAIMPLPQVVRADEIKSDRGKRYELTIIVPGLGTIRRCTYFVDGDYVAPPSSPRGGKWEKMIDWTTSFAEAVRAAAEAYVATPR